MVAIQMVANHRAVGMAIGTPTTSVRTLGHPDGGDSAKACALLAFASPADELLDPEMLRIFKEGTNAHQLGLRKSAVTQPFTSTSDDYKKKDREAKAHDDTSQ